MDPQYYGAAAEYNKPKGSKFLNPKVFMIAGGVLVGLLLLMVGFAVLGSLASGPRNDTAKLAVRAQGIYDFIDLDQKNIKDSDLSKIAEETKLFISTNSFALTDAYAGEIPDSIAASEADTTSTAKLESATKAGKHDEVFLEILTAKVASAMELAQKVKSQTSGAQTRTAADQTISNLQVISDQLDALKI